MYQQSIDLYLQNYLVGGDSTINRFSYFVFEVKINGRNHNRIIIIEVFLRYAGLISFRYLLGAELIDFNFIEL